MKTLNNIANFFKLGWLHFFPKQQPTAHMWRMPFIVEVPHLGVMSKGTIDVEGPDYESARQATVQHIREQMTNAEVKFNGVYLLERGTNFKTEMICE